jgi:hypothetical protein
MVSSAKDVTSLLELVPELWMVENIACRYKDDLAVFVCQRLANAVYVQDVQSDVC